MWFRYLIVIVLIVLIASCGRKKEENFRYFTKFSRTFNDMNPRHLEAAQCLGVKPVASEEEVKNRKMVEIESCRLYEVDDLTHSLPYLVPEAYRLLEKIAGNFRDSLDRKDLPSCKLYVTSLLRTHSTVRKLRQRNMNASANSAHIYGTTFDLAYARYKGNKETSIDKLKTVLAEVLRDLREQKKCYVRYEYKQGCFHITVR